MSRSLAPSCPVVVAGGTVPRARQARSPFSLRACRVHGAAQGALHVHVPIPLLHQRRRPRARGVAVEAASSRTKPPRRIQARRAVTASATAAPAAIKDEVQEVLRVAVAAAQEGAKIIRAKNGADVIKTKGNPRDLLTEVDSEVQRVLDSAVKTAFPHHGFLGEEDVPPGPEASAAALEAILSNPDSPDWLWIVDPIDGTTNFVHGMPLSAISIGVAYKGELMVGLIMDPFRDECFTATLGGGAFCNGEPIKVGSEATAGDATVCTGYGATGSAGPMARGIAALSTLPVRTIRMLGSAAIMFAWVSNGRLTAYFEADLNPWDIAGGALLVNEAGGKMSDINGEAYTLRTRCVIGSNGRVHDELCTALQKANVLGLDAEE